MFPLKINRVGHYLCPYRKQFANVNNFIAGLGILVQWKDDADDVVARSQIRRLISSIESISKERGCLLDFKFMNDASYEQSPLSSYGAESLSSLWAASKKWDPEGVFQQLQNLGFLLPEI